MSKNKIIILGCGSSGGVPSILNDWGKCNPLNHKNYRTRASIYIEIKGQKILIDTSPDLRQQMLANKLKDIDTILYTHAHADHTHGIDELRRIYFEKRQAISVYASETTFQEIIKKFNYLFNYNESSIYPKVLEAIPIKSSNFKIGDLEIKAWEQKHGQSTSTGFRIGNIAYSTDFNDLNEQAVENLQNLDTWIVDCLDLSHRPKTTHICLDEALGWIDKMKPKKAILTHMDSSLDYDYLMKILPSHIQPAYDGMVLDF